MAGGLGRFSSILAAVKNIRSMHQRNPFAAPESSNQVFTPLPKLTEEGSLGLGIVLGVVLGLWGWLGCLIFAKPLTKRGAGYGFLGRIGLTVIVVGIAIAAG
jgi:hypothetical protein